MAGRLWHVASERQPSRGTAMRSGALLMIAATVLAAMLTDDTIPQLVMVALSLGAFTAVAGDMRASVSTTLVGFVLFEGLLADRHGYPLLDFTATSWHLSVLMVAAGLGLGQRWLRHVRDDAALDTEIDNLLRRSCPPEGGTR